MSVLESRFARPFCLALAGGLLAGVLAVTLLRWRRMKAAPSYSSLVGRSPERFRRGTGIVLTEVS